MLPCYRASSVAAAAPHAEFYLLCVLSEAAAASHVEFYLLYALSVAAAALSAEVRKLGLVV